MLDTEIIAFTAATPSETTELLSNHVAWQLRLHHLDKSYLVELKH